MGNQYKCKREPILLYHEVLPTAADNQHTSSPGAVVLLSISTGPLGTSTSNRWIFRYTAAVAPWASRMTWLLYRWSGSGPTSWKPPKDSHIDVSLRQHMSHDCECNETKCITCCESYDRNGVLTQLGRLCVRLGPGFATYHIQSKQPTHHALLQQSRLRSTGYCRSCYCHPHLANCLYLVIRGPSKGCALPNDSTWLLPMNEKHSGRHNS